MANESDVQLVQRTFEMILPIADTFAAMFYDRFFAEAPDARRLFSTDMSVQREKVIDMLALAVRSLDNPDALKSELTELGDRHVEYRVDTQYYEVMNQAILGALQDCLGERFTSEMVSAWEETLQFMTTKMITAYTN